MTEKKTRRQRRTKASIVASIDKAAREEIASNGFVSSLVTNIIKNAQIEPQVFYNRYKDINEFYDAFVRQYDGCLDVAFENADYPLVSKAGLTSLLHDILDAINSDPVALELLRWEVSDKNKTTSRTAVLRELNFQPLLQACSKCFAQTDIDPAAILVMLVGGIYYVSLRRKLAPMYGLDIDTPDGRGRIERVIAYLVSLIFEDLARTRREQEIARRLRASGVSQDVIANAFMPPPSQPFSAPAKNADIHRTAAGN